jgi:hypothetical protein
MRPSVATTAWTSIPSAIAAWNDSPQPRTMSSSCGLTKSQHSRELFQGAKISAIFSLESSWPAVRRQ